MHDGYFPLGLNPRRTTCRSCGAAIAWVTTAKGAHMPLDLATVESRDDGDYALTHFARCPQGAAWSKGERPNVIRYHGPTGDTTDPDVVEMVARYRRMAGGAE